MVPSDSFSVAFVTLYRPFDFFLFFDAVDSRDLLVFMLINLKGITTVGHVQLLLMTVKITILFAKPISALFFFYRNNFIVSEKVLNLTISQIFARSSLLTLWCFIGLETATASAGSVENSSKTIPRAIVLGTICVAVIYFINSLAIMGLINGNHLANSEAPYVDAIKIVLPGSWYLIVSIIAFIVSTSSLNAWFLADGQVALGLAKDKLMTQLFAKKNKHDVLFCGMIINTLGIHQTANAIRHCRFFFHFWLY